MANRIKDAYRDVKKADVDWSAELKRTYGDKADDYRFTPRGYATAKLNTLRSRWIRATNELNNLIDLKKKGLLSNPKKRVAIKRVATKRVGTSTTKKSMATRRTPSKRLKTRRAVNTRKGYYPNPVKRRVTKKHYAGFVVSGERAYFCGAGYTIHKNDAVIFPTVNSAKKFAAGDINYRSAYSYKADKVFFE